MITKEAIEAASAGYIGDDWTILAPNTQEHVRTRMRSALEASLSTLPIAGEGKALDEEQIAKLIWQHLPSKVAEEMTRDKHPPLFPQAEYTVATLSAKNFVEAIIDLVFPYSPGKDGGQEVAGYTRPEYIDALRAGEVTAIAGKPFHGSVPLYTLTQPASTALVEALEVARDQILTMYRTWVVDDATAIPTEISLAGRAIAKIDAALSASTSREGER